MLKSLSIENLALIDRAEIEFGEGLNILTGETGSGKSIVIDGIGLALGTRADRDLVQRGSERARVEGLFLPEDTERIKSILKELAIPIEDDGSLLISRELSKSGRNTCRINGRIATLSMLRSITEVLVDIHGQHQHQSLLNPEKHIDFIDEMGGSKLLKLKDQSAAVYGEWMTLRREMNKLAGIGKDGVRRTDILKYQINEIEDVSPKAGESEKLERELKMLQKGEQIKKSLNEAATLLRGEESAFEKTGQALKELERVKDLSDDIENIYSALTDIYYNLEGMTETLRDYSMSFNYDAGRLNKISERLYNLQKLKGKYGSDDNEILVELKKLKKEYNDIMGSSKRLTELKKIEINKFTDLISICRNLSTERKKTAAYLEKRLMTELSELGMDNTVIKAKFSGPKVTEGKIRIGRGDLDAAGYDKVEFLISTNPGQPLKPLSKIASGGELSRIMLAFKVILSDADSIETMIFDEIDSGVSGRAAQILGEKMSTVALRRQIICVTHLPQIAALADHHFNINKAVVDNHTRTSIKRLDSNDRLIEIAVLISGTDTGDTGRRHAGKLIDEALKFKQKINY